MEGQVITTTNPSIIQNIECILTRGDGPIKHTTLRFYLNEFADFLKQIDDLDWQPMKVSYKGKMKDNPAARSSKMNKNVHTSFTRNKYNPDIKLIYIKHHQKHGYCCTIDNNLIKFDTTSLVNGLSTFKIIRYDKGDHFDEFHYDTMYADANAKTLGTALLFPPADISPFTGGDIVFKIEEDDQVSLQTIQPSKFKEWTLITFGHVLHKCTPVLSGTRYVFKAEIWSMYPNIMKPVELSLEMLSSLIKEKQSHKQKQELLSQARQNIADLYSVYLDDIRIKLEAKQRAILDHSSDKIIVLSKANTNDIHYKNNSILTDECDKVRNPSDDKYKEASHCDNYENKMYLKLDLLQRNYNNLVIFLNDDNDIYLNIEQILSIQDFSTESISLKYNRKSLDDYEYENQNADEFNDKLKTIFVLSSLYKEPYDFNTFDIKHLKLLRQIINSGYKFTLFNKRYEMFVPILDYWKNSISSIRIEIDRESFNWIFECPKYPGVMLNKESEYNDEGGCDDTFTFESTCILIWLEE